MNKRKPNSAHARMVRYSRAMLRSNHVAVIILEAYSEPLRAECPPHNLTDMAWIATLYKADLDMAQTFNFFETLTDWTVQEAA